MIVAGIGEWARRVRELRREDGWRIISGVTLAEMLQDDFDEDATAAASLPPLATDEYMLLDDEPDLEAARRWHLANRIRKSRASVRDKILEFFRENVGSGVTGEELRYVAGDKTEWARRTRELRTEFGWPVLTQGDRPRPTCRSASTCSRRTAGRLSTTGRSPTRCGARY